MRKNRIKLYVAICLSILIYSCITKENKKLFLEDYYSSGSIKRKSSITNDSVLNGMSFDYFENGKINSEVKYKMGRRDGSAKWYDENGGIICEVNYVEDKLNGISKWYYSSGVLKSYVGYDLDGKRVYLKEFNREGKVDFIDGTAIILTKINKDSLLFNRDTLKAEIKCLSIPENNPILKMEVYNSNENVVFKSEQTLNNNRNKFSFFPKHKGRYTIKFFITTPEYKEIYLRSVLVNVQFW